MSLFDKTLSMLIAVSEEELAFYGIKKLDDHLTLKEVGEKWPWVLEAEIEDAFISSYYDTLIFEGIWISGEWQGQDDKGIFKNGVWKNGLFSGGEFKRGIWEDGKWYMGKWGKDAEWLKGEIYNNQINKYEPSNVSPA